jgi:hypothetical protein
MLAKTDKRNMRERRAHWESNHDETEQSWLLGNFRQFAQITFLWELFVIFCQDDMIVRRMQSIQTDVGLFWHKMGAAGSDCHICLIFVH